MSIRWNTIVLKDEASISEAVLGHIRTLECIGSGLYANVYSNDTIDIVVKITSGNDLGYLAYIKAITAFELNNSYIPRILKVIHYRYADDSPERGTVRDGIGRNDRFVITMEKLDSPMRDNNSSHGKCRKFNDFVDNFSGIMRNIAYGEKVDWSKYSKKHQEVFALLEIARESIGARWYDLHTGNIMMRGSQFVITDPISHT